MGKVRLRLAFLQDIHQFNFLSPVEWNASFNSEKRNVSRKDMKPTRHAMLMFPLTDIFPQKTHKI